VGDARRLDPGLRGADLVAAAADLALAVVGAVVRVARALEEIVVRAVPGNGGSARPRRGRARIGVAARLRCRGARQHGEEKGERQDAAAHRRQR